MKNRNKSYAVIIGLYLTQLVLILVVFRLNWKLLIFITIFFLISLCIKFNWLSKLISFFSLLLISIPALYYRIPNFKTRHSLESKIQYQMIDFGQGDMNRCLFESVINNRRIFLVDKNTRWLYVDNKFSKLLWPESPWTMRDKKYTIKARFTYYDLILGGHTLAKVDSIWMVNELPAISK